MSLNFLQTSCMIRLPVDPACSRSLAGPFFLISIFLLSGCFPVALPAAAPIASSLSCALGAPLAALGAPGQLVLSLSLSLSPHLAVLLWLRFSVRLRFRVTSRAGEWRAPRSHRSRLQNLEQVFGCQPTSCRGLSCSSVPSLPTPQLSPGRAVRPERLSGHTPTRAPIDWEKQ